MMLNTHFRKQQVLYLQFRVFYPIPANLKALFCYGCSNFSAVLLCLHC